MQEKILKIEEKDRFEIDDANYSVYDGFFITTNKQVIIIAIQASQSCCEDWGYFMTNDDISEFIGAELKTVEIVDDCLIKKEIPNLDCGDVMFVNFETDKGTLQFTAYNSHNGYYGHEAIVRSEQLNYECDL